LTFGYIYDKNDLEGINQMNEQFEIFKKSLQEKNTDNSTENYTKIKNLVEIMCETYTNSQKISDYAKISELKNNIDN